jgi:hypothetical protein
MAAVNSRILIAISKLTNHCCGSKDPHHVKGHDKWRSLPSFCELGLVLKMENRLLASTTLVAE